MLELLVDDVVRATGAKALVAVPSKLVTNVQTDSRRLGGGSLFVCFAGERVDGNDFAAPAVEAGSACVVMTREPDAATVAAAHERGCALLRAEGDDGEEFLLRLAGLWRERNPQWVVVGVTGSVGKTTTKDMLAAALATGRRVHATAGNFNNLIGLPLTLLSASATDEVVVAEMGMNHKGELSRLTRCARPDLALITNVGTSHIGMLGSRENIARAKAEILEGMRPTAEAGHVPASCLVLCGDNDFAPLIEGEYARPAGVEVAYVGPGEGSVARAERVELDGEGRASLSLAFPDGWERRVTLGTPGRHVVWDFLLAMAVADRLGVDRAEAADAIATMPQTHMRLEVVTAPGRPRVIDDSYNASPSSIAAALDVLLSMRHEGRRVAVLGEVGELGDESARLHGYIGAYAAAKGPDLLVLVGGEAAAQMAEAARTMGFSEDRLELVPTAEEAVRIIGPVLGEGDLVLAKGSRSVGLDRFVKGVLA
ncbi:UDP-N-acetylmuramoyl-tripeptide--D-alanyl-D-alanine ligase [Olsenella phocaeensis]|uniref:UDP-N-acetylmuramoyl-tripeptide--D-alanyl-D- alanine ligase n=1 Tax=Olsenella phocaeensis TaxID=1852385 RepID=UPI003A8EF26F